MPISDRKKTKKLKGFCRRNDKLDMMITKSHLYSSLSVVLSLTLSACAHKTVQPEVAPVATTTSAAAIRSFVDRSIASGTESALVESVAHALLGTADEEVFLTEAGRFLSTDERLTATNVARSFTEEQGEAFLNKFRQLHPRLFEGALSDVGSRLDHAIQIREAAGSLESHSTVNTGISLVQNPTLVTVVRHLSPELRENVVGIYQLTHYEAASTKTCNVIKFSKPSQDNVALLYNELSNISKRMPACVRNPEGWMMHNTAVQAVMFTSTTTHAAEPYAAAENLSNHCDIPPKIAPEIEKLRIENQQTGRSPAFDYTCNNY
jgi:hypothetical protein